MADPITAPIIIAGGKAIAASTAFPWGPTAAAAGFTIGAKKLLEYMNGNPGKVKLIPNPNLSEDPYGPYGPSGGPELPGDKSGIRDRGVPITIRKKQQKSRGLIKQMKIIKALTQPQFFTIVAAANTSVIAGKAKIVSTDSDFSDIAWKATTMSPVVASMDMDIVPQDISDIYQIAAWTPGFGQRVYFGRREFEYEFLNQQNTPLDLEVYVATHKYDHYTPGSVSTDANQVKWRDVNELIGLENWNNFGGSAVNNPGCVTSMGVKPTDMEMLKSFLSIKPLGNYCLPAGGTQTFRFEYDNIFMDDGYHALSSLEYGGSTDAPLVHLGGHTKTLLLRFKGEVNYEVTSVSLANRRKISTAPQFLSCICRKKYTLWFSTSKRYNSITQEVTNNLTAATSTFGSMNQNAPANLASLA